MSTASTTGEGSLGRWLQRLRPKSAIARGVGMLVGGTAGAQLLALMAAPLLTRLYTPEDFGLLAVYAGLLGLVAVVASLRYELAIPLPQDDDEASDVVALSLMLVVAIAVVAGLLTLALRQPIADSLGVPRLAPYLWLLPLGVLAGGFYNVFNYWAVRGKRFSTVAGTRLAQASSAIAIQLAAFRLGGIALVFAHFVGQTAGTFRLARIALAQGCFRGTSWAGIRRVAGRYRRFPLFSTWEGLANATGAQLPPLLLAMTFGPAAAGLYSLAQRLLTLPMSLVGSATGQVFFSHAAEAHRDGRLAALVTRFHTTLANIGLPPAVLLVLLGPDLFTCAFGENWRQAGEFARWMTPWLYLGFVSSPLSTLIAVLDKLKQSLAFQVFLLTSRFLAIGAGILLGDLDMTVILFSVVSGLCYLAFLIWIGRLSGVSAMAMMQPTASAFGTAIVCAAPVMLGMAVAGPEPVVLAASVAVSAILIGVHYWRLMRKAYL